MNETGSRGAVRRSVGETNLPTLNQILWDVTLDRETSRDGLWIDLEFVELLIALDVTDTDRIRVLDWVRGRVVDGELTARLLHRCLRETSAEGLKLSSRGKGCSTESCLWEGRGSGSELKEGTSEDHHR